MLPGHDVKNGARFPDQKLVVRDMLLDPARASRICDVHAGLDLIPVIHRRVAPDRGEHQCGREVLVADIGPGSGHEVDR